MESRFGRTVEEALGNELHAMEIDSIVANLGLRCNMTCAHCHVESSPKRVEAMTWPVMQGIVDAARSAGCRMVDITGGAPEYHPKLRQFIEALGDAEIGVQLRTNLTALLDGACRGLMEFLRERRVQLVASLPDYIGQNVDQQRGEGAFEQSIEVIRQLNSLGYARDGRLGLDLVHNPTGEFLPPNQEVLEAEYRLELEKTHGVYFTHLLALNNVPLGRFLKRLREQGRESIYRQLLVEAFNPLTLDGLMCRHCVTVRWDGALYDCDFNLACGLPMHHAVPSHLNEFESLELAGRKISVGEHCFGCTAGHGSSFGGALAATTGEG